MFENTTRDMYDCIERLGELGIKECIDSASSEYEAKAVKRFLSMCLAVAEDYDQDDVDECDEWINKP